MPYPCTDGHPFVLHFSTLVLGTAYTQQYSDTACTQKIGTGYQETLTCQNAVGHYASAYGYCNKDPSEIPLPAVGEFTTQM